MRMRAKLLSVTLCVLCLFALAATPGFAALKQLPSISMKIGMEGDSVRVLQEVLLALNLYSGKTDGIYDAATATGVRKLQTMLQLPEDGVCGEQTIIAYNAAIMNGLLVEPDTAAQPAEQTPLRLSGKTIGIDAGHQKQADTEMEPVAPKSSSTKVRMSEGGTGVKTGIPEYETNLLIANKLKRLLEAEGATVVMSRTKHDVNISNAERAKAMNAAGVDFWIRIHCDYSNDRKKSGICVLAPSVELAPEIAENSLTLAKAVLPAVCKETGAKQLSISRKTDQVGFNWSNSPVIAVELGFLSNPVEDVLLNRDHYQALCATGIFNGILLYYNA